MSKTHYSKSFTIYIVIILIAIVILSALFSGQAAGAMFGAFAREGTPAEGTSATGTLGPIPPSCNGILSKAQDYIGINYSQDQPRCGGNGIGRDQMTVTYIDCSGYVSRVYRDAGLFPLGTCHDTSSLAVFSQLQKIAGEGDTATAKQVAEPGDIILFGLTGNPPTKMTNSRGSSMAHAVIYAGSNQAYESTTADGIDGVRFSADNVWGGGRYLYGVFRTNQDCGSEE